jgi:hypothetical protein
LFTVDRYSANLMMPCAQDYSITDLAEAVYDHCGRPAMANDTHMKSNCGNWPASYLAEESRIRRSNTGHISVGGGVMVSKDHVSAFAQRLLVLVREEDWGKHAFWYHQIRGVQGRTKHDAEDREDQRRQFDEFMSMFHVERLDPRCFWVDVGCSLQMEEQVLVWREDAHPRLLSEALNLAPFEAVAEARKADVDQTCMLSGVAGLRHELTVPERGIYFLQLYTSEKRGAYQMHGGVQKSKHLNYTTTLRDRGKVIQFKKDMDVIFQDSEERQNGHARFECRIRLDHVREWLEQGQDVAAFLPNERALWMDSVYIFHRQDWWFVVAAMTSWRLKLTAVSYRRFKLTRLSAFVRLILQWHESVDPTRLEDPSIGLIVALVWMTNALNSRPFDKGVERDMRRSLLPWDFAAADDDGEVGRCVEHYGLLCVAELELGFAPSLGPGMTAPAEHCLSALTKFYDGCVMGYRELRHEAITQVQRQEREETANPSRVANKGKRTISISKLMPEDYLVPEIMREYNHVRGRGTAAGRAQGGAGGNAGNARIGSIGGIGGTGDLHHKINYAFAQFLNDIKSKAPNMGTKSSDGSYLKVKAVDCAALELFGERNLGGIFHHVAVLEYATVEWNLAFDLSFPEEPWNPSAYAQNWNSARWTTDWRFLVTKMDPETRSAARFALRRAFDRFVWFPSITKDRWWMPKVKPRMTRYPVNDAGQPLKSTAPVVLVNPAHAGDVYWTI